MCVIAGSGCRAQAPNSAELNHKIERQVRASFGVPPYVDVTVGERTPSTEFGATITCGEVQLPRAIADAGAAAEQGRQDAALRTEDGFDARSAGGSDGEDRPGGPPGSGNKDAKVTMVVYDDFQCPYCSRLHQTLIDLLKSYGDRSKLCTRIIRWWRSIRGLSARPLTQVAWRSERGRILGFADYVHANGRQIQGEKRPVEMQLSEVDRITMDVGKRHSRTRRHWRAA